MLHSLFLTYTSIYKTPNLNEHWFYSQFSKITNLAAKKQFQPVKFKDKLNYIKSDSAQEWRPFSRPPLSTGNLLPYEIPDNIAKDHLA